VKPVMDLGPGSVATLGVARIQFGSEHYSVIAGGRNGT
jgi:hypothetical protein